MADFEDITGWRDELEAFESTEEGRKFFGRYGMGAPKLTYEQEVRFAEELFRHEEIHEALKKSAKFVKYLDDNPDFGQDDEGFWDLCPVEDNKKVEAFKRWYAMKQNIALGWSTFSAGKRLAIDVANGETNAASSASSASTSASAASGSASSASASASAASSSASSAASSATAAQTAQTAAEAAQAAAEAAASNDAAGISITAGGNLSATNVQAALEELDSEKAPVSAATTATSALNKANANETAIGDLSFALDFIATADLSNDATVEFTGFDPGAYDAYVFVLGNVVPSADGARLVVRLSNDGGSSFRSGASDYAWSTHRTQSTGSQDAADSSIRLTSQAVGSASAEHGVSGRLTVYFPHLSKKTMLDFYGTAPENSGTFMRCSSGGQVNVAEANNAIQLLFTSGNIESGTMTMYGMRNA